MLAYVLVILAVALIAGLLGLGGVAGISAGVGQMLFFLSLAFLIISLVFSLLRRPSSRG